MTEVPLQTFSKDIDISRSSIETLETFRQEDAEKFFATVQKVKERDPDKFNEMMELFEEKLEDPHIRERYSFLSKLSHEIKNDFNKVSFLEVLGVEEDEVGKKAKDILDFFEYQVQNPWIKILDDYRYQVVFNQDIAEVCEKVGFNIKQLEEVSADDLIDVLFKRSQTNLENTYNSLLKMEAMDLDEFERQIIPPGKDGVIAALWTLRYFYATELKGDAVSEKDLEREKKEININKVFRETTAPFVHHHEGKKLDIQMVNKTGENIIYTHLPSLMILLRNFTENLYKYGGSKGKLVITQENGSLKFAFRQEKKVSQKDADKIMRGVRLEADKKGTGYGLSIMQDIVSSLGGEIGIETEDQVKSGSTFFFTLPLVKR